MGNVTVKISIKEIKKHGMHVWAVIRDDKIILRTLMSFHAARAAMKEEVRKIEKMNEGL